jgi:hypothetical protein
VAFIATILSPAPMKSIFLTLSLLLFSCEGFAAPMQGGLPTSLHLALERVQLQSHPVMGSPDERWFSNVAHGIRAQVGPEGFSVTLEDQDKTSMSRWRTVALGYGGQPPAVGKGEVATGEGRLEIRRPEVTEWLVNRREGIEHGYTLASRPRGHESGGPLRVVIDVAGETPGVCDNGQALALGGGAGDSEWCYDKLKVWDADGKVLGSVFRKREGGFSIEVDDSTARYPVIIDPLFARTDFLKASNTGSGDLFGYSVATDGTVAVVGASSEDGSSTTVNGSDDDGKLVSGAAYVFRLVNGEWAFEAYLKATNSGIDDEFGYSVAVDGDLIVVGARNEKGSSGGVNGPDNDLLDKSGAAYVFARSGGVWSQQAYLKAASPGENDLFGFSVGVSGERVIVGAYFEDGASAGVNQAVNEGATNSGAAFVFRRVNGTDWEQEAYLKASNPGSADNFGFSVSIDGDLAVVGALGERSNDGGVNGDDTNNTLSNAGAAYVFTRESGSWVQDAYLKASEPGDLDQFGCSVSISGETVIVGAWNEDGAATVIDGPIDEAATDAGAAYVFTRGDSGWEQQAYLKAPNADPGDFFGRSVAIDGDFAVVAADFERGGTSLVDGPDDNAVNQAGSVYVFRRNGDTWVNQAYLKSSSPGIGNRFGFSLALADGLVLVGEPFENSGTTGVNPVQTSTGASASGAVHVFRLLVAKLEVSGARPFKRSYLRKKSRPMQVLIRNTGGAPLEGLALAISGKAARDFRFTGPGTSSVEAGGSTSVSVTFKPRKVGKRMAILTVSSADESKAIPLSGKATGRK